MKYGILNIYNYLENPLSKIEWKKMIKTKIYTYWKSRSLEEGKLYKSLKFMDNADLFFRLISVRLIYCSPPVLFYLRLEF
jgi:hypothetical protein